jgi:hypothetical protein
VLFDKPLATLIQYPGGLVGGYSIPNSVASIGDYAFEYCTGLTSVTIPNSVTSIGSNAFKNCSGLTSVTIPDSVTSIDGNAFYNCYGLTSVTIPNSVTSIGSNAFENCYGLTSVTIPDSVTSIGGNAFYNCSGLTSVTIPDSVSSIGDDAFANGVLTAVFFLGNAPSVDPTTFQFDSATGYYLPGTTGWSQFAATSGIRIQPWTLPNPIILNNATNFGPQPGGFSFTASWAGNATVVVEAATNLAVPSWQPLETNAIFASNGFFNFSDPAWTNYPIRFYRIVAQAASFFTVGGTLTGLPAGDTVTLQDNGADTLTLSNNGTFTFPTALLNGGAYSVTVSGTRGTSLLTDIYSPVPANGSGTISGANVTNVAVQCTLVYTGNLHLDMYNAAVADGTANGGVPAVMLTEQGGPFRETALGLYSDNICNIYSPACKFAHIVGTGSCSSTSFPAGTPVIQFGTLLQCGFGPYRY